MGNLVPRLIGCAPHLDYEILHDTSFARSPAAAEQEARKIQEDAIYGPCCQFQPTGCELERCLGFLNYLKSCTSVCPRCCMNIPYVVECIRQDSEREQRFLTFDLHKSGAMWRLYLVLSGGWGVHIDCRLHLDMTRAYCEFIEENLGYDCTGWWDVVLDLVCDGVDARWSRNVILRTLWKERQASIVRARQAYTLAECSMLHQYRVPRDLRRLICRMAGAYTRTTWMHWTKRLASLFVLWGKKEAAIHACHAARYAFHECLETLCLAHDKREGQQTYNYIRFITEDLADAGTELYSRSAWLHWVDTHVLPGVDIGAHNANTE